MNITNQEQQTLDELRLAVDAAGCTLVQKDGGHYQVVGRLIVNYWPFSKGRTAHVKDAKYGHKGCSHDEVIRLALGEPRQNPLRDGPPEPLNPVLKPNYKGNAPW